MVFHLPCSLDLSLTKAKNPKHSVQIIRSLRSCVSSAPHPIRLPSQTVAEWLYYFLRSPTGFTPFILVPFEMWHTFHSFLFCLCCLGVYSSTFSKGAVKDMKIWRKISRTGLTNPVRCEPKTRAEGSHFTQACWLMEGGCFSTPTAPQQLLPQQRHKPITTVSCLGANRLFPLTDNSEPAWRRQKASAGGSGGCSSPP